MVIVPLGKLSFVFFGGKVRFLKGERGKPIYWCMLFRTNSFLSFSLYFRSNLFSSNLFFSSLLTLFFLFYVVKNPLFFPPLYRARQGPLYSACRD